jgi:GNAT superfamily N-acetyltransferase
MTASDHLSNEQFYTAPTGKQYQIRKPPEGWNLIHAHVVKPGGELSKAPVASLSYFDTNIGAARSPDQPTVYKAFVKPPHRRKGVASAMFDFADQHAQARYGKPLQHSEALSEDGKAFVEGHQRRRGEL